VAWERPATRRSAAEGVETVAVQAYVLVRTMPGQAGEALTYILNTPGVSAAHAVTGPTDIIAFVEAPSMDALGRLIVSRIQQAPGVTRTTTCVVTSVEGPAR
jgi:DNA-binding Lrp family transcriptional regulator